MAFNEPTTFTRNKHTEGRPGNITDDLAYETLTTLSESLCKLYFFIVAQIDQVGRPI